MEDFLEIDIKATSSESLVEYLRELSDNPNHSPLVGRIKRELALRGMREQGLTPRETVRILVRNTDKRIWPFIADEWAESLGIDKDEFLRIAKGKATR